MKCDAVSFGFLLLLVPSKEATGTIKAQSMRTNGFISELDHGPHINIT
jgi:hypothetical protein